MTKSKQERRKITAEILEPIVWDFMYDDMEGRWPRMVQVMETDPLWANGKHCGDCTKECHTCQRCLVEENKKDAAKLARALNAALAVQPDEAQLFITRLVELRDSWLAGADSIRVDRRFGNKAATDEKCLRGCAAQLTELLEGKGKR